MAKNAWHKEVEGLFPEYSVAERIADAVVHGLGIGGSVTGLFVLVAVALPTLPALPAASLGLYAGAVFFALTVSALYHLISPSRFKEWLRRLDHAAIYILIAATYTPFSLVLIGGIWGYSLFGVVWSVAFIGVYLKLRYPRKFERTALILYLVQGWTIVIAFDPVLASMPADVLTLLVIGGVLYTVGVIFHLWEGLRFHNVVWHALVLVATGFHYVAAVQAVNAVV